MDIAGTEVFRNVQHGSNNRLKLTLLHCIGIPTDTAAQQHAAFDLNTQPAYMLDNCICCRALYVRRHMLQPGLSRDRYAGPGTDGREQTLRVAVVLRGGAQQNHPVAQLK